MNKIELMGRMTRDIELKKGKNDNTYGIFTLAINRKENKEQTDFINCVAFGKLAETIKTYTEKGNRIIVTGSLHLDNYTAQDGTTKTSCNIIVDDFYFVDFKRKEEDKKEENTDLPF